MLGGAADAFTSSLLHLQATQDTQRKSENARRLSEGPSPEVQAGYRGTSHTTMVSVADTSPRFGWAGLKRSPSA